MDSSKSGISISVCNITSINDLGFWVLVNNKEYFIPFSDYQGFKDSSINQIFNIKFHPPSQLHWEELNIDIELNALIQPESFPLIFK
jgi:hypothetical protein